MAKLVGIPYGVTALIVLGGRISQKAILAPMNREFNKPIVQKLKDNYGIFLMDT